jgi:internalin A
MKKHIFVFALLFPGITLYWGCTNKSTDAGRVDTLNIYHKDTIYLADTVAMDSIQMAKQKYANLSASLISDLSFLKPMTQLEWLNLANNDFSDLTPLSGLTSLKYLNIAGCTKVMDLTPLKPMTNLEFISIHSDSVADISTITKLTNLKKIDMGWDNHITVQSYAACSTLTKLEWVSLGGLGAVGTFAWKNFPNLQYLQFTSNAIVTISLTDMPKLKTTDFQFCDSLGGLIMKNSPLVDTLLLKKCAQMKSIDIENMAGLKCLRVSSKFLDPAKITFSTLPSLSFMEFQHDTIKNVSCLSTLTSLKQLAVFGQSITDISGLKNLTALDSLIVSGCDALLDFSPIGNLTNLTKLGLPYCGSLDSTGWLSTLTKLTMLDLNSDRAIKSLDAISGMTQLTYLNLRYCQGLKSLPTMSGLTALKFLSVANCSGIKDLTPIAGLTGINNLNIQYTGIDSTTAAPVIAIIGAGDTLRLTKGNFSQAQLDAWTNAGVVLPEF